MLKEVIFATGNASRIQILRGGKCAGSSAKSLLKSARDVLDKDGKATLTITERNR